MISDQDSAASINPIPVCPLCHATEMEIKYSGIRDRLGYVEGAFDFYQCMRCVSVSLHPFPGEDEISSFYPGSYMVQSPPSDEGLAAKLQTILWRTLFLPVYRSDAKTVIGMAGKRNGKLLEIGCSSGYVMREFSELGEFELRGLDIDKLAVDYARQELGLQADNTTLQEANYPPNSFDMVILFNVFEHLVKPLDLLRDIRRVLKPGGYLAIKTPRMDSMQGRILGPKWMNVIEAPRHVLLASAEGVKESLRTAGLRLVDQKPASLLESSVFIALSLVPNATADVACRGNGSWHGYLRRIAGIGVGLAVIPFAIIERVMGRSGTTIYLAQKDGGVDPGPSD
jgi:SAM-dependent methyltransferase